MGGTQSKDGDDDEPGWTKLSTKAHGGSGAASSAFSLGAAKPGEYPRRLTAEGCGDTYIKPRKLREVLQYAVKLVFFPLSTILLSLGLTIFLLLFTESRLYRTFIVLYLTYIYLDRERADGFGFEAKGCDTNNDSKTNKPKFRTAFLKSKLLRRIFHTNPLVTKVIGSRFVRNSLRNSPVWQFGAGYYPISMWKTTELPAENGPYLFAVHPPKDGWPDLDQW